MLRPLVDVPGDLFKFREDGGAPLWNKVSSPSPTPWLSLSVFGGLFFLSFLSF